MAENDNKNLGHRERLRQRYRDEGLDSFRDYEVLEFLLFYVFKQRDTKPLAKNLIDRFGSFSAVLDASMEEITRVEGVGKSTAVFIKMLPDVFRYYSNDKVKNKKGLSSVDEVAEFLEPKYIGKTVEVVYVVCLDSCNNLLLCEKIQEGTVNQTNVNQRKIVEAAIRVNATGVIISHNHPNGIAVPSKSDITATRKLREALELFSIRLIDHLIFAPDGHISLGQNGFI